MILPTLTIVQAERGHMHRELCPWTRFSLVEILVLVGGAIPPAPAVPASTRISARLKRVQEHSSRVSMFTAELCFQVRGYPGAHGRARGYRPSQTCTGLVAAAT